MQDHPDALRTHPILGEESEEWDSRRPMQRRKRLPLLLPPGPFKSRRRLVTGRCLFEWQSIDAKTKAVRHRDEGWITVRIRAALGSMARSRDPSNRSRLTVITTDPNESIEPLHNRMPVILGPEDYHRWLTPGNPDRSPVDLLRPFRQGDDPVESRPRDRQCPEWTRRTVSNRWLNWRTVGRGSAHEGNARYELHFAPTGIDCNL
jgi:SOS response associated peptidase (SRAP)